MPDTAQFAVHAGNQGLFRGAVRRIHLVDRALQILQSPAEALDQALHAVAYFVFCLAPLRGKPGEGWFQVGGVGITALAALLELGLQSLNLVGDGREPLQQRLLGDMPFQVGVFVHNPRLVRLQGISHRIRLLNWLRIWLGTPCKAFSEGSGWIPGSYAAWTGLKRLLSNGFFQSCRLGHDPHGTLVKTICYTTLDPSRPWHPICAS